MNFKKYILSLLSILFLSSLGFSETLIPTYKHTESTDEVILNIQDNQSLAEYQNSAFLYNSWEVFYQTLNVVDGLVNAPGAIKSLASLVKTTMKMKFVKASSKLLKVGFYKAALGVLKGKNVVGKASLLVKFKDFVHIKSWISGLNNVADANLLSKLDKLEANYFAKLDGDLVHAIYGPEIKALLKESPDDLADVWKRLKDDPAYSWEIQKTGGSRWEKWSQREFFKDITAKGKNFESTVCLSTFKNRSSAKYLELKQKFQTDFGKNLDDYDMYSQVQLKYDGENYFVADQLFVKRNLDGDIVDLVVIENKLSSTTPLTTPQSTAFTKTSFTVRSLDKFSEMGSGLKLDPGTVINFNGSKQWYKVHDGNNGDVISGINKMQ